MPKSRKSQRRNPSTDVDQAGSTVASSPVVFPSHLPLLDLIWTHDEGWMRGSKAMLSTVASGKKVVVFIHGWGGKAVGTWDEFHKFIRATSTFAQNDILFFGYPSRKHSTAFCAARFRLFLKDLLLTPALNIIRPTLGPWSQPKNERPTYERVLLCAHSMGAVVVRRALVDLEVDSTVAPLLSRIGLLLFAPAHKGSHVPLLITDGLGLDILPGARAIAAVLRIYYRSVNDLEIGSDALKRLEEDTRARLQLRRAQSLGITHLVASVMHAEHDKVVSQEPFAEDLPFEPVMQKSHTSICRPTKDYTLPVDHVEGYV